MRVALTQSEGRLDGLADALAGAGHEVLRAPLVTSRPRLDESTALSARSLLACPWLLVTSRATVEAWQALGLPFAGPALGAVGPGTARAIERAGGKVALVADPPDAAGLAATFLRHVDPATLTGPVALPGGDRARLELSDTLTEAGVDTRPLVVYDTVRRAWTLAPDAVDAVLLASPSAVEAVPDEVARRAALVALGPSTSAALRSRGFTPLQASAPDTGGVLTVLERLARR